MTPIKTAIILASLLVFVASNIGCDSLAVSGPKKYKVDLQNHMLNVTDEIQKTGLVSDRTLARFDKFMAKNEAEFGTKGSWMRANEALEALKQAAAASDTSVAFGHYNVAKHIILQCQDLLITEIKE